MTQPIVDLLGGAVFHLELAGRPRVGASIVGGDSA